MIQPPPLAYAVALDQAAYDLIRAARRLREAAASLHGRPAFEPRPYRVVRQLMTVARPSPTRLSVWGTGFTVLLAPDNIEWALRLSSEGADPVPGIALPTGAEWGFLFTELYLENEAGPPGTRDLILLIEQ